MKLTDRRSGLDMIVSPLSRVPQASRHDPEVNLGRDQEPDPPRLSHPGPSIYSSTRRLNEETNKMLQLLQKKRNPQPHTPHAGAQGSCEKSWEADANWLRHRVANRAVK